MTKAVVQNLFICALFVYYPGKMKKIITLTAMACLVLLFVSGCVSTKISSEPIQEEDNSKPLFGVGEEVVKDVKEKYPQEELVDEDEEVVYDSSAPPGFPE